MKRIVLAVMAVAFMMPVAIFAQKREKAEYIPVKDAYYISMDGKKTSFDAISTSSGKMMIKKGNTAVPLKDYKYIMSAKTEDIVKADTAFAAGDFATAIASYEKARKEMKEWTLCWEVYCLSQTAQAYSKSGKLDEAIATYTALKDHTKTPYPNDAVLISKAVIEVAKTELAAKKYDNASFTVRKAINSDDQDVACEAFLLRGDILKAIALDEAKTPKAKRTEALQHAAIAYFQAALLFKPVSKDLAKKALTASRDIMAELGDPNKAIFEKKLSELEK